LCIDAPIQPVPESGSTTVAASATAAYKAAQKTYNEQRDVQIVWDNKALGIIQLRMADKLQYLVKDTSLESVTTRYGLLHYANLIRRTGPYLFSLSTYLI
jgi:hypothetical protein